LTVLEGAKIEERTKGREEGHAEGIRENKVQTARTLKAMSLDNESISKATGLTIDEINEIE
jgi:predicted transposase/invertase (TIGR01784 family)